MMISLGVESRRYMERMKLKMLGEERSAQVPLAGCSIL